MSVPRTRGKCAGRMIVRRGWRAPLLLGNLVLLVGCSKGLTEKDVARIVAEHVPALVQKQLEEQKLVKPPNGSQPAASNMAQPPHVQSSEFLAKLDELMLGYSPTFSAETDTSDVLRCSTKDEIATNKDVSAAATKLKSRRQTNEQERAKRLAEFEKNKWLQYRIDFSWQDRVIKHPTVMGCWDNSHLTFSNSFDQAGCTEWQARYGKESYVEWKVQVAGGADTHLYSGKDVDAPDFKQPPELMKRIESSGVVIPERFFCAISDAVPRDKASKSIACAGEKPSGVSLRVVGTISTLHIGDVVSVPLKEAKRDPDGVLLKEKPAGSGAAAWVVDADAATLKVESPAKCPSVEEIVAAASANKPK